jgi:hypothetical protein
LTRMQGKDNVRVRDWLFLASSRCGILISLIGNVAMSCCRGSERPIIEICVPHMSMLLARFAPVFSLGYLA